MDLLPDDRRKLTEALVDAFPTLRELHDLAFDYLPQEAVELTARGLPSDVARSLILWASSNDRIPDLLSAARAANPDNLLLAAVAESLLENLPAAPTYRAVNPYLVCLPRPNLPFVGRAPLRNLLQAMVTAGGPTVLAVQGAGGRRRVGKSYTAYLVSYLSAALQTPDQQPVYKTVEIDLATQHPGFDASDLAYEIATQLGQSESIANIPPRPETEQDSRWATRTAAWVVGEVRNAVARMNLQHVWLVADGFQQATVTPSVRDTLNNLVARARTLTELRVVLIDYPDAFPGMEQFIDRDQVDFPTLADLVAFYGSLVKGTGSTMGEQELQRLAQVTWDEAGPQDDGFMSRLNQSIKRFLPGLLQSAPPPAPPPPPRPDQ